MLSDASMVGGWPVLSVVGVFRCWRVCGVRMWVGIVRIQQYKESPFQGPSGLLECPVIGV